VRGFGLDKQALNLYKWVKDYSPPPLAEQISGFAAIAGVLVILVGGYLGGTAVADAVVEVDLLSNIPRLIGEFLNASTYFIAIGICVILSGRAVRWFFDRDLRLWRTIVIVVGVAWSSVMFVEASKILIYPPTPDETLIWAIVGGPIVIVATVLTVLLLRRRYSSYFEEKEEPLVDLEDS
jgi:hypothetical protein